MLPRSSEGKLDRSIIKKIYIFLDSEFLFPEMLVAYSDGLSFIEPITKNLMEEVLASGIEYDEKMRRMK